MSSQKLIVRNRALRTQTGYDVELYDVEKEVWLFSAMGVMVDPAGKSAGPQAVVAGRRSLEIDVDSFDAWLETTKSRVAFNIPDVLTDEGNLSLDTTFEGVDDSSPAAVAHRVDLLNKLLEMYTQLVNLLAYTDGKTGAEEMIMKAIKDLALPQTLASVSKPKNGEPQAQEDPSMVELGTENLTQGQTTTEQTSELVNPLLQEFKPKIERARETVETAVWTLAEYAPEQTSLISDDAIKPIESTTVVIDTKLTTQINLVMCHVNFQRLESAWRGLYYLINNIETDEQLKTRVLNISKPGPHKTLKKFKGTTWDQSPIFKEFYEEEYGRFGSESYGCLVGDCYFDQPSPDIKLLGEMMKISAIVRALFISAASPTVMSMGPRQELLNPHDLTKTFTILEYVGWRSPCEPGDFHCISLTMSCFLARLPYGAETDSAEEFVLEEEIDGTDSSKYTRADSVHATVVNINRSFKFHDWHSRIRDIESGDEVQNLPMYISPTDDGGVDMKCPAEIVISNRREAELVKSGFVPLLHKKNADFVVFIGAQPLQKPAKYNDPDATASTNLVARLPYLFATCRFAHYPKYIVRDKIGSFREKGEMQRWLQDWIPNYAGDDPAHSTEITKAQYPLVAAEAVVEEVEDNPGCYSPGSFLRPRYQLEGLTVSLRLISKLPSAKEV